MTPSTPLEAQRLARSIVGVESRPLAIDLFCGLGGWTEGLLAAGYRVIGVDIEEHAYGDERYPGELMLADCLTVHGAQFKEAALIVSSSPCTEYSYMAMPWTRAKARAAAIRADETGKALRKLNALFDAQFRIQREASEAAGHHIPMVAENVRGAQPWVGPAAWNFGSFYLWGDVPALMPAPLRARKNGDIGGGSWLNIGSPGQKITGANPDGRKNPGFRFDGSGKSFQTESVERHVDGVKHPGHALGKGSTKFGPDNMAIEMAAGRKGGGDWFGTGENCSLQRRASSGSTARKAASAKIAKIPLVLSSHIARTYYPREAAA